MKLKKVNAILIFLALVFSQNLYLNSCAINENNQKVKKINSKKVETVNKLDYINLDFWKNYGDDNLNYYITRAIETNYDLKVASLNSEIYKNYITAQRAAQMPTVGAGFAPSYAKLPNTTDFDWTYALPIYVNYEADIFLKNRDKTSASKKNYEMSLLDEKSTYISVASVVGSVYFNIIKLDKVIEYQKEIVNLRKEIYNLMNISHEEGIISTQDVIRANKSYIAGNTELINLEKQRLQLINNLSTLIGTSDNSDFKYSNLDNIEYKGEIPESLNGSIIVNRPDYIKAEKYVEKAGLDVRIAKKEFLPSINITGLSLFNAGEFSKLLTTKTAIIGLGGSVLADLFTGGRKVANLRIKKTEYEKSLNLYEKTNIVALQEINDALVAINHDKTKYNENKKQNNLEERDYDLKELKFREGVISKLELIQAKENLLTVKKLVASDKADCFIDYIGLYKATGTKINL